MVGKVIDKIELSKFGVPITIHVNILLIGAFYGILGPILLSLLSVPWTDYRTPSSIKKFLDILFNIVLYPSFLSFIGMYTLLGSPNQLSHLALVLLLNGIIWALITLMTYNIVHKKITRSP